MTQRIAILTSGGDAPGMNAAIRALVCIGSKRGFEFLGVRDGFCGLIENDFFELGLQSVSGILGQSGTILGSARCDEFRTEPGLERALSNLNARGVSTLVIIGGNGSQTGAKALSDRGFAVIGIASTIDNDLYGSDVTLGFDTALNVATEAIDRLRATASSHRRVFLVEVMGRDSGYLALCSAITGGADAVVIPEKPSTLEDVTSLLNLTRQRGKKGLIIVVAEGARLKTDEIMAGLKKAPEKFDVRVSVLGHIQRGGVPSSFDRMLAARFAAAAIDKMEAGVKSILIGVQDNKIVGTDLELVEQTRKQIPSELLSLTHKLWDR